MSKPEVAQTDEEFLKNLVDLPPFHPFDKGYECDMIPDEEPTHDEVTQVDEGWLKEPTSQGWWWHVYDDYADSVPFIYSILQSNSGPSPRFFVAAPDSRWCGDVGGLWKRVEVPDSPAYALLQMAAPKVAKMKTAAPAVTEPRAQENAAKAIEELTARDGSSDVVWTNILRHWSPEKIQALVERLGCSPAPPNVPLEEA